jgi:hypothetical protein
MNALCPTCAGKGRIQDPIGPEVTTHVSIVCKTCGGSGWVDVPPEVLFGKKVHEGVTKEGTLLQEYGNMDARWTGASAQFTQLNG